MQASLRRAARAEGIDDQDIGTHSLRVTCACWLYQAGYDIGYIKRHGRWISDVVHVYLWEGMAKSAGVCKKMSEASSLFHVNM